MGQSFGRRVGAILAVVVLLSVLLVPAASAEGQAIHIVAPGETLYQISLRYGVGMYAIAAANGITNLNAIYVGQRLVIPGAAPQPPAPRVHVVRAGETLSSIARLYGVDMYALARANNIYNLNRIYPGQRLVISGGGAPPPAPAPTYYTVRYGDTLAKIAARFGTTVWSLMQLNHISNPNLIYAGQVLRVSGTVPPPGPPPPPPPPSPPPGGWTAQYYNTRDLSGAVALSRTDADLNFNWGFSSPAAAVFADNFSARWNRTFNMSGGTYRITARVDDGVRVYVDGVLVIDAWQVQAVTTYTRDVIIPTGNHTFTVEYFEAEGVAEIHITSQKL